MPIIKQNNKVDVKENQDLLLSCIIANSKPAAEIKWYRGNVELKSTDNRHDDVIELDNKRFTVSSNLTIKASANDDLVDYKCRAKHLAISPDHPLQSIVQVSVLKAPGEPFIEGYSKGEKLRNGQEMELVCRSYGGNPPAQLIWYKNNRQVVSQYTTSGRDSASTYRFKVQPGDNKARLRCEASNTISDRPLKKEIDLTVLCEYIEIHIRNNIVLNLKHFLSIFLCYCVVVGFFCLISHLLFLICLLIRIFFFCVSHLMEVDLELWEEKVLYENRISLIYQLR